MNNYVRTGSLLTELEILQGNHKENMDECDADKLNFNLGYCNACRDIKTIIMSDKGVLTVNGYDAFAEYVLSKKEGEKQ